MKLFISLFLIGFMGPSFGRDTLLGKSFSSCDSSPGPLDQEYIVEYMPGNEEFEAELFIEKGRKPCSGVALFAIGRIWNYEINQNELVTTLQSVKLIILDSKALKMFNKNETCGVKNWKVDEVVSCGGKTFLNLNNNIGHRSIHEFKYEKNKLIVTDDDGESFELTEKK